uniref:Uncharacterized protein n=1 Tax=Setaria viridis TaxID=4556 RepID=A0A4V6D1U1_SETVI|nr:hypothetical protein SEVIR_9G404400v2 [Setaria viridis]
MAAEELVLLAQDDKTVSLAVIPAITPSPTASEPEVAAETEATFRLVVEQSYRCGGAEELRGAAAVDRAFEDLLTGLDHPTLRREVAPEAREAAARVRARCAEEGDDGLGSAEFCLRVVLVDSFDDEDEPDCEEETGSDLELDEESWSRGRRKGSSPNGQIYKSC